MIPCQLLPGPRLVLAVILIAVSGVVLGDGGKLDSGMDYSIRHWTSNEGLPANRVTALAQTPDGYVWCGTWFGLARFDGVRFVAFNPANTPALQSGPVNALAVDRVDGSLWVGTRNGLLRRSSTGAFERIGMNGRVDDPIVWRLLPRRRGGVWAQFGETVEAVGLDLEGRRTDRRQGHARSWKQVRELVGEAGDDLVLLTESGLHRIPSYGGESTPLALAGVEGGMILGARLDSSGEVGMVSTPQAVLIRTDGQWTKVVRDGHTELGGTRFLGPDGVGQEWVSSWESGIGRIRSDRWERVRLLPGEVQSEGQCLLVDREGGVWIGTADGVFRLERKAGRTYARRDGMPHDEVWTVQEDRAGRLWCGTSGGAAVLESGRVRALVGEISPESPNRSVLVRADGAILFGKQGQGILSYSNDAWGMEISGARLGAGTIRCLYKAPSGLTWLGSSRGAFILRGEDAEPWPLKARGLEGPIDVMCVHEDRDGGLWFGTADHGLIRWSRDGSRVYRTPDGLAGDSVWAVHEDGRGVLWLGGGKGLSRVERAAGTADGTCRIRAYGAADGIAAEEINQILEDDLGYLWMSTLKGVLRVRREWLDRLASGASGPAPVRRLGASDGMESTETNGECQPAGCRSADGRIWFPTTRGLVGFDPRLIRGDEAPATPLIEEVVAEERGEPSWLVGPQASRGGTDGELPPGATRSVRIRFTSPSFNGAHNVRFRHRLVGLNDRWSAIGTERVALYGNVGPGRYRFEVAACGADGIWQQETGTYSFRIVPRLDQTAWFPWALGGLGLASMGAFAGWRLRWQRRTLRAEQAARIADERARIARDLHDEVGSALTGVALELDVMRVREGGAPGLESLGGTSARVRQIAGQLREVVWVINPRCDTVPSLALFLEEHAARYVEAAGAACRLEYPDEVPKLPLSPTCRHHLMLGVREALSNAIRHGSPGEVCIRLWIEGEILGVEVKDNGCGFDPSRVIQGHGLTHLRERASALGGGMVLDSAPGRGTSVRFSVPLDPDKARQS